MSASHSSEGPGIQHSNKMTGRSAFLALLEQEGVTHLFGNPGTTELPIMHALTDVAKMTYVMAMQESLVVAMADGYARASGKLVAANVHVAPGLGNAMGALYNAKFTGTPMILTAGQQEQGHGLMEPLLYDPLVPIAEPLVKWAVEVNRLEDLPRILHRAAKIAMTPPTGPVFISLPGDILNEDGGIDLARPTRVDARVRPSDAAIEALADRLLEAKNPVLVCGNEIVKSDALEETAKLTEVLGCGAYQNSSAYGAHFLSVRPGFLGALTRNQEQVRKTLAPHDLIVSIGADFLRMSVHSETDALPEGVAIVQIGLVDWELGKNYPAEIALKADVGETLRALIPVLQACGGLELAQKAEARLKDLKSRNWTAQRAALVAEIERQASAEPMTGDWLSWQLVQAMPDDGILVHEGLTTAWNMTKLFPYRDRFGFHGLASGGIGWGLPAAVGVQMAQPDRPVTAIIGDGSAMYSVQALWTAAHHQLPMAFVICNNGGYRIIKQRLKSFHGNEHYIGMDFADPPLDWLKIAEGLGMRAHRLTDPTDAPEMLREACSGKNGPVLIDAVVDGTI